eukprot:SAG31_NODE_20714_length_567_cov_0.873932_2_plen_67_part_01
MRVILCVLEQNCITVRETTDRYDIREWMLKTDRHRRPCTLLLAAQLCQEEFYILRRVGKMDDWAVGT